MFVTKLCASLGFVVAVITVITGQHLRLEPCKDGVFEVVDNVLHNVIACVNTLGRPPIGHLTWRWTLTTSRTQQPISLAECQLYGACKSYAPFAAVVQSPEKNASELSISTILQRYDTERGTVTRGEALFGNGTITCQDPHYLGGKGPRPRATCRTDFVRPVQNASCSATFNTDTSQWNVVVHCDANRMFSAMGRYTCRLISVLGDDISELGPVTKMTTTPIQRGRYVRGSCDITAPLPSTNGRHRYLVEITPGWRKFEALFEGSNFIRKPTEVTLTHDCPQRVLKGELVNCTCSASDAGNPPGKLTWDKGDWAQQQAKRDSNWRHLKCQLVWNGTTVESLSFKVEVLRPPSSPPTHNCPEYVVKGSDVSCDCVTSDVGNPPATVQWDKTNSSVLLVSDVKRDDIWKTFTCRMTWNGTVRGTVKYKVAVIPDNDTQPQGHFLAPVTHPGMQVECKSERPTYIRGLATGVGIGLAVLLLFVVLAILLLWRRRWVLPCAEDPRKRKEKELRDARRQSAVNGEPRRPSQSSRGSSNGLAFSSNVYDQFDRSQMTGLQAPYESLKTQPKPAKRTKKQAEKKANGQRNSAFVPTDNGASYEGFRMQQRR